MKITNFKELDNIIQKIKTEQHTNSGFLFNGHSYWSIPTYIDKCGKRIDEVNANLSLLKVAYKSSNTVYTLITFDDRRAIREKTGKTIWEASLGKDKVESLLPARTQVKNFYLEARKPYLEELKTLKQALRAFKLAYWVQATADNVSKLVAPYAYFRKIPPKIVNGRLTEVAPEQGIISAKMFTNGKKPWYALPLKQNETVSDSYRYYEDLIYSIPKDSLIYSIPKEALRDKKCSIDIGDVHEFALNDYTKHVVPYQMSDPGVENIHFYGRAIIWCGDNIDDVPLLISLKCKFDSHGNIEGLPDTYKILMFHPIKVTATFDCAVCRAANRENKSNG